MRNLEFAMRLVSEGVADMEDRGFKVVPSVAREATAYAFGAVEAVGSPDKIINSTAKVNQITKRIEEILSKGRMKKNTGSRNNPHSFARTGDPTREEMIDYIKGTYGREADPFDIEEGIYWFANDYHGGQGSNLYRVLSTSKYHPGPMANGPEEGSMSDMIYVDLANTFTGRKNPVKPRKGEKARAFVSRCMSEEKASFPEPKQRIAVCLSKSRKRNPVYDTGSDE